MYCGHMYVRVYVGICLNKDGRTYSRCPPLGFVGASDSESGAYGICGYLCACRHVLPGEAADSAAHGICAYLCGCVCVCRQEQRLLPPRVWGKWWRLTQLRTVTGHPQAGSDFMALLTCQAKQPVQGASILSQRAGK